MIDAREERARARDRLVWWTNGLMILFVTAVFLIGQWDVVNVAVTP